LVARLTQEALLQHTKDKRPPPYARGAGLARGGGAEMRFEPAALPFHCVGEYCK
jgi:hypothetical protein